MPQLTFHAGLPKTGSSFLQARVFRHARGGRYLRGQLPFSYVQQGLATGEGPMLVSDERLTWPTLERDKLALRERENTLASLCRQFPQAQLLLFVREPSELIRSHYAQFLHDGGPYRFDEFFRSYVHADAFQLDRLIEEIRRQPWRRVLLIDYADLNRDPQRVVRLIEAFTGLQFPGWQGAAAGRRVNPAISGWAAGLLRRVNALVLHFYPGQAVPSRIQGLRGRVRRMLQSGWLRFLNRWGEAPVPKARLQQLRSEYEASWQRIQPWIADSQKDLLPEAG